jgi:polyphosphate kinase
MAEPQTALASIGDSGALNTQLKPALSEIWIDRDLSWLDFNQRVLAEALDERTPLLERAKFLAIFISNLDEFFMKRVAVVRQSLTPDRAKLLHDLNGKLLPMLRAQAECFRDTLIPELARHGIFLRDWEELTSLQEDEANLFFNDQISQALTPLVIKTAEAFPFLSNLSTSLVFPLEDSTTSEHLYARVKVPSACGNGCKFMPASTLPNGCLFGCTT